MSQENVENVRRGIDGWNRGDLDQWLGFFAPEAELHTAVGSRIRAYIGGVRGCSGTGPKSARTSRNRAFQFPTFGLLTTACFSQ